MRKSTQKTFENEEIKPMKKRRTRREFCILALIHPDYWYFIKLQKALNYVLRVFKANKNKITYYRSYYRIIKMEDFTTPNSPVVGHKTFEDVSLRYFSLFS